jgi:hypothetical protein
MNRRLFVCATALLIAPWHVQGQTPQTQTQMSPWEFRQVLIDLGSYLDAHKGTDLRQRFESIPIDMIAKLQAFVPNPPELQSSVAALKKADADAAARVLVPRADANATIMPQAVPQAVVGSCPPDTIIDNSSGAACTPAYPDPTNVHWQGLIDDLNGIHAFSPSDYNSVKSQQCGLTTELNLQRTTVTFVSLLNTITPLCSIIPAPANAICEIPLTAVAIVDAVSQSLYSDCLEQDGLVNAAEIDAGFHNTVTIYDKLGAVGTSVNNVSTQVSNTGTQLTNLSTQLTNATSTIDTNTNTAVSTATTTIDGHTDSTVSTAATNINNNTNAAFNNLSSQVNAATNLLAAYLQQIMKLDMTPEGQRQLIPNILTCDGTAAHPCPKPLAACQPTGCSWNTVGPLP